MDGVIVDFVAPICEWLGIDCNAIKNYELELLFPERAEEIRAFYGKRGYFRNLRPYAGAIEFIHELEQDERLKVWIVSRPSTSAATWSDKVEWVQEFVPGLMHNLILTLDKSICALDVFVDDDPNNLKSSMATEKILFNQPWNRECKEFERTLNYQEVLEKIKEFDLDPDDYLAEKISDKIFEKIKTMEDSKIRSEMRRAIL